MNSAVTELIGQLIGKPCSRKEVGRMRSLSLGFGADVPSDYRFHERTYREWEVGTYRSAWRVVQGGVVLCGSQDAADSIGELDRAFGQLDLGRLLSLRQIGDLDVQLEFDNGAVVDFLMTTSDDDECFHVFCPGQRYVEFSVRGGWKTGPSNKPWDEERAPGFVE